MEYWGATISSKLVFCRLTKVNAEARTCDISTFGADPQVANGNYANVQWLAPYSNPDGDELNFVPRVNSFGVAGFIDGQPYVFGFYHPVTRNNLQSIPDPELLGVEGRSVSAATNKEKLIAGDILFRGIRNNRILLTAGGIIEIEATKLCKRSYFQTQNRIVDQCQNFEFNCLGGNVDWKLVDRNFNLTRFVQVWLDDAESTNIIVDEKGTVETGSALIFRHRVGPGDGAGGLQRSVIQREEWNDGTTLLAINDTGYQEVIEPDGHYAKGLNDFTYFQDILPTGEMVVNIANNWQLKVEPDGTTNLDIGIEGEKVEGSIPPGGVGKFHTTITPDGGISLAIEETKFKLGISNTGAFLLDVNSGKAKIDFSDSGDGLIELLNELNVVTKELNLKADKIKLGSATSDVVVMGKLIVKVLNKFIAKYNVHQHPPIPPLIGGPVAPPLQSFQVQPIVEVAVLSNTVKVQK